MGSRSWKLHAHQAGLEAPTDAVDDGHDDDRKKNGNARIFNCGDATVILDKAIDDFHH